MLELEEDGCYLDVYGTRAWYLNGEWHRVDGPAFIDSDGSEEYWLHGKQVPPFTKEQFPLVELSVTKL